MKSILQKSLILLGSTIMLVSGCSDVSKTEKALETYQRNTADLNIQLEAAIEKQVQLSDRIGEQIASGSSARQVFTPQVMEEYAAQGKQSIQLGKEYLNHYRIFLSSIDEDSTCFQPSVAEQIDGIIKERENFFQQLETLPQLESDQETVFAWLGTSIANSQTNLIMPIINMTYLCLISDAFGMTQTDLAKMENDRDEQITSADEPPAEFYNDSYFIEQVVRPGDQFSINDYLPESIESLSQIAKVSIPAGISIDQQTLSFVMPKDASPTDYVLEGEYQLSDTRWDLKITLTNKPKRLISELQFTDPSLKSCIDFNVAQANYRYVEDLVTLLCDFDEQTFIDWMKQPIKNLAGIEQLESLEDVRFMGNQISDYSPLARVNKLAHAHIKGAHINDLSWASKRDQLSLILEDTQVDNLSAIAEMNSGLVAFLDSQPQYCAQFANFTGLQKIFLYYGSMDEFMNGLSETELFKVIARIESDPAIMLQAPIACRPKA